MFDENLLEKYLDNCCTPDEARIVLEWLSSYEGQSLTDSQFDKGISALDSEDQKSVDQPVRSVYMFQQILQKINSQNFDTANNLRRLCISWMKIAAAILIPLLLINATLWYVIEGANRKAVWQEVYVPKGEKLRVMFQDGTKVWLNSDTRLKYPVQFSRNKREVELTGEAYFEVKKDTKKPFIVGLDNIHIKVTGTSFNVKDYQDEKTLTVSLDEGRISLQTLQENDEGYILKPGQQALYSKTTAKLAIIPTVIGKNAFWKDNKLVFQDTPLKDVIKVLERWYNVKFEIEGRIFPAYTYTIRFQNESIQDVLFGLEKITPVRFQLINGKVLVYQKNYSN